MTWDVGGMAETAPAGLGRVFPAQASSERVASSIAEYVAAPESYEALRARVAARAHQLSWDAVVQRFVRIWEGSEQYRFDARSRG